MVVIPTSRHVTLHYGYTPVDRTGWALSLLGVIGVVALTRRRALDRKGGGDTDAPVLSASVPTFASELEPEAPQPVH